MNLLDEALGILTELGIPVNNIKSSTRRVHVARAFTTLAGLKPGDSWSLTQDMNSLTLTTKKMLAFSRVHLGETRSDGSYDDVRRGDLIYLTSAGIVQPAANKANAKTNDSTRGYGIHPEAAAVARKYGTADWAAACKDFHSRWKSLREELERARDLRRLPVRFRDGTVLRFQPDSHNQLQKAIIEEFLESFGFNAHVLYVGDTNDKDKYKDTALLSKIGVFQIDHDKLPDVIAFSAEKNWLFLIEAVTTANPVTELRRLALERALEKTCTADRVYVSAFPDRDTFRKFASEVAWETEVWISNAPEHLIHFNGDKFLGPYKQD
jgi:hypothetical protein